VRIGAMMEQRWYLKKDSQSSNEKNKEERKRDLRMALGKVKRK